MEAIYQRVKQKHRREEQQRNRATRSRLRSIHRRDVSEERLTVLVYVYLKTINFKN